MVGKIFLYKCCYLYRNSMLLLTLEKVFLVTKNQLIFCFCGFVYSVIVVFWKRLFIWAKKQISLAEGRMFLFATDIIKTVHPKTITTKTKFFAKKKRQINDLKKNVSTYLKFPQKQKIYLFRLKIYSIFATCQRQKGPKRIFSLKTFSLTLYYISQEKQHVNKT